MSEAGAETPMRDRIERFWRILETEHVRILVDTKRNGGDGISYFDSSSFPDDVAKALVSERRSLTATVPADIAALTPLEWSKSWGPDEDGDEHHTASTPFGSYTVERSRGRWKWKYCFDEYYDEDEASCRDLDEGKAAAQAHWNERVSDVVEHLRSALTAAYASLAAETERRIAAENDRDRFIEGKVLAEASLAEARKALAEKDAALEEAYRIIGKLEAYAINDIMYDGRDVAAWCANYAARRAHKGGADHG